MFNNVKQYSNREFSFQSVIKLNNDKFSVKAKHQNPHQFDFLVWTPLMRDFQTVSSIISDRHDRQVLASNFPVFAATSLLNIENDVLQAKTSFMLSNIFKPFDNGVGIISDGLSQYHVRNAILIRERHENYY